MTRGGKRKGAGRPPSDDARGVMQVRLTEAERAELDRAALAAGQRTSTWMRDVCLRAAKKGK